MGKKYEYVIIDRKRILMVHNVTEEDVGIYECVLADDRLSLQLTLKGTLIEIIANVLEFNFIADESQQSDDFIIGTRISVCNNYCRQFFLRPRDILKCDLL